MRHLIATTLEQSRKLIELGVSPDTADMHYAFNAVGGSAFQEMIDKSATLLPTNKNSRHPYEPAWSLSALLELIPSNVSEPCFNISKGGYDKGHYIDTYFAYLESGCLTDQVFFECRNAGTAIEATYELIVWLVENNYIKPNDK